MALTQVTKDGLKGGAVESSHIKDNAVSTNALADNGVQNSHLADNTVDSAELVSGSVDIAHLSATGTASSSTYLRGDNAWSTVTIAADSVNGDKIVDDAIGAEHIADNAVGLAAMAHGTDGNLITYNASGAPDYVVTGSSGEVLTSNGAGAAPTFQATSSAGKAHNLIINGAMNIAQRGTSDTSDGQGFTTVDRWRVVWSGLEEQISKYQESLSSSDTGPWEKGFRKAWKIQNGNQTGGADASGYINPQYSVEAHDLAFSGWNPADPNSKLTLSFWVKSSVAQTFHGYLYVNDGGGDSYSFSYALSANTWTKVTKTIPGHADLAVNSDNGPGMTIYLPLFMGTDRTTSGHTLNQWQSWSGSNRTPDQTTTWYTTNDATWHLTGVQLEVGDATDFEHKTFADELRACERYYYSLTPNAHETQAATENLCLGFASSANEAQFFVQFPNRMCKVPSIIQEDTTEWFLIGSGSYGGNKFLSATFNVDNLNNSGGTIYTDPDSDLSSLVGDTGILMSKNASAILAFDAEI